MHTPKRWHLLPADTLTRDRLRRELNISPVLAQLLINRGVHAKDDARRFLDARLSGLHDPDQLPGIPEAAARLYAAVRDGRKICVYGDYDVDGITATTLLWRCLQVAGAKDALFYVPDRLEEGYGLNPEALRRLHRQGVQVVVTVDCGITSLNEAKVARELGLELIITDHHEFKAGLPDAVLVHPRLPDSAYPFRELCGAGVAFKLAWAVCQQFSQARKVSEPCKRFLLESVALVALGTVADVVPLVDENRIFVRHGLKVLQEEPSVGLKALLEAAALSGKDLDAGHIGFNLAPRLNAAGRLGQAQLAVELLSTTSAERAAELALYLNKQNDLRQQLERQMTREATELAEREYDLATAPALVLAGPDWHPGVIGIVAGRLVDRFARPVLMITQREKPGQGSGRSIAGFHLHQALNACTDHLISHGGHAMAAGFKVAPENLPAFREAFLRHAAEHLTGQTLRHTLTIDAEVPLATMTLNMVKSIHGLQPHGQGNRRPVFLTGNLQVQGTPRLVGNGERHLSFSVRQEGGPAQKVIAWGMAERVGELMSHGGRCCLVFTPKINAWQGGVYVDLEALDFQPGPVARLD